MNTETQTYQSGNKKLTFALIRCVAALVIAAILLAATGFSVVSLLRGPVESPAIQDEEQGAFVYRDVNIIIGFYADDANGDKVTGRYGLVPMNGKLATVRFTGRYLENAGKICDNTYDYFNGKTQALNEYVVVQGTVDTLTEDQSALMYDWFGLNKDQLVEIGFIGDTDDYAQYLSDEVLLVDTVQGYDQRIVIILSSIAGALLLYMLAEMVLMACGVYKPKRKKAHDGALEEDPEAVLGREASETAVENDAGDAPAEEEPLSLETDEVQGPGESGGQAPEEDVGEADGEKMPEDSQ